MQSVNDIRGKTTDIEIRQSIGVFLAGAKDRQGGRKARDPQSFSF